VSQSDETDPKQKLLINVLLKNADARREVLPRLGKLTTIENFRIWPLLRVMIQLEEQGGNWGYAEVEGRLNEEEKALLAAVVFADPLHEQEASLEQALSFLPTLERKEREAGQAELKQQIRSAEKAGDLAEVMRLMEALNRGSAT
jgi:alpha-D-ribose 1-methylphosphonate 5-triphosphate synthase subunit PhnG